MRLFILNRVKDESGVSGTGIVAEGVEFSNKKCVITWLTEYTSIAIYDSVEDVKMVHGHDGKTQIMWLDNEK